MSGMKVPEDEEQRNIIDKLANFVARNGPKFEDLTKSKQKDNEKFAFLFGGEYHAYYKWKVSLETTQAEAQRRLQEHTQNVQQKDPVTQIVTNESNSQFDLTEFRELLQKLVLACTKDNIQNGKNWLVTHAKTDVQLKSAVKILLWRMLEETLPFQQKLHIVYLANDVLHHSRKKDLPQLQIALQHFILPIIAVTHNGESQENQTKLAKVIKIWENQKFFTDEIREKLRVPSSLYDNQLEVIDKEKSEVDIEKKKNFQADEENQERQEEEERRKAEIILQQHQQPPPQQQQQQDPTKLDFQPQGPGQFMQFQQFNQWNRPPPNNPPDPYHFFGAQYPPPPHNRFDQPRPGFPLFQGEQGFDHPPPPAQPGFQQFPPPHVQTFDYSHQSLPAMANVPSHGGVVGVEQSNLGPVTFDYEHGNAPIPDGVQPMHEDVRDPTIPMAPYYDLPAGLMVPLVKLWDCEYRPLDPKDLRLPIPQPPSERLLAAIEAFYAPPSHDRPRDSQGWEKNGLFEFFKAKLKYIKDKERNLQVWERTPSPPSSRNSTPEPDGSELVRDAPPRSESPPVHQSRRRSKSRSVSREKRRSRSKSVSRSPKRRRSRSHSYSRSRSHSRTPPRKSPVHRSPTPPESFVGFETKSLESRIEESNVGHQMLKKMGWGGLGLGKKGTGILDPIKQGEVRDRQDKFKGIGVEMNDPFETYRKNKSYTFGKPRERKR